MNRRKRENANSRNLSFFSTVWDRNIYSVENMDAFLRFYGSTFSTVRASMDTGRSVLCEAPPRGEGEER
jgi:hypothetical protein